jgi:hypothetical protein
MTPMTTLTTKTFLCESKGVQTDLRSGFRVAGPSGAKRQITSNIRFEQIGQAAKPPMLAGWRSVCPFGARRAKTARLEARFRICDENLRSLFSSKTMTLPWEVPKTLG